MVGFFSVFLGLAFLSMKYGRRRRRYTYEYDSYDNYGHYDHYGDRYYHNYNNTRDVVSVAANIIGSVARHNLR